MSFSYSVAYPYGSPSEYSITAAFEVVKVSPRLGWDLWQVSSPDSDTHVSIHVLTDRQALGVFYAPPDSKLMLSRVKNAKKAFDGSWHKTTLSKKENNAKLLLDC